MKLSSTPNSAANLSSQTPIFPLDPATAVLIDCILMGQISSDRPAWVSPYGPYKRQPLKKS